MNKIQAELENAKELIDVWPNVALEKLAEILAQLKPSSSSHFWVSAYMMQGRSYKLLGNMSNALSAYGNAEKHLHREKDRRDFAQLRIEQAPIFDSMGNAQQCVEYLREALALYEQLGDIQACIDCELRMSLPLAESKQFEQAANALRSAQNRCYQYGIPESPQMMTRFGAFCRMIGDEEQSLVYYMRALELLHFAKSPEREEARIRHDIGLTLCGMQHWTEGIAYLEQSLNILVMRTDEVNRANTLGNIAQAYYNVNRFADAYLLFYQSYELSRNKKLPSIEASALFGIALCTFKLESGDPEPTLDSAEHISREYNMKPRLAACLSLRSEIREKAGNIEQAEIFLRESLELNKDAHENFSYTQSLRQLASVLSRQGKFEEAYEILKEEREMASNILNEQNMRFAFAMEIRLQLLSDRQQAELYRREMERLQQFSKEKESELSALTLAMTRTNEGVRALRKTASEGLRKRTPEAMRTALESISLSTEILSENTTYWESFERAFRAVHPQFLTLLLQKFPTLSKMELRICALLRRQHGTKEMTEILNVSDRTIESHRYNIRKKLALDADVNLATFLTSIEAA